MEIGVPTTPLGQGNPLKEGNVSQTGFPASFPADMWARKDQNSFIRGHAERGIPSNISLEGFLLLPNVP